jgi:plastocyanin
VTRSRTALLMLFVLFVLAVAGCGGDDNEGSATTAAATEATTESSGSGGGTTLNGSVGPGFDISLDGTDGLTAGSYTLVVNDQSSSHNFHLTGPGGVDVSTSVEETGEKSFDIKLQPGEYKFVCDPHASQMNGSFTVG